MSGHWCLVFLLLLAQTNCGFCEKFHNYTLFGTSPKNEEHVQFLRSLSALYNVDYWRPPGKINNPVEFMVAPNKKKELLRSAGGLNLKLFTILEDVQRAFDNQKVKPYVHRRMDTYDWGSYYQLEDIYQWMRDIEKAHPGEVTVKKIGRTYEHREILVAKVVLNNATADRTKVIIEGGIHAREWISPAFVTFLMGQIINSPESKNEDLIDLALNHEWHFIPVVNADGYVYTHITNRLWRKNRNGQGVDLNRNFGIAFGTLGALDGKNDPKDETYTGIKPFSEIESVALANYVLANKNNLTHYLSFHSYGQYIIIPYAYKEQHSENYEEMKMIGEEAAKAIQRTRGTKYKVGTAFETVGYKTSGVSTCWIKKTLHVPYVATFELPDEGKYGFALPTNEILPTCQETMHGVVTLLTAPCKYLRKGCSKRSIYKTGASSGTKPSEINALFFMMLICFGVEHSVIDL